MNINEMSSWPYLASASRIGKLSKSASMCEKLLESFQEGLNTSLRKLFKASNQAGINIIHLAHEYVMSLLCIGGLQYANSTSNFSY